MNTVVCVKVGTKYGAEYVNRLQRMIVRHTEQPTRLLCLTDDPFKVECDVDFIDTELQGWWSKLILFKPHPGLPDKFVYMDLDTVIIDNIDWLFDYDGEFKIVKDWWAPGYNSSVMCMKKGNLTHVWDQLTMAVLQQHHGDQDWITRMVTNADIFEKDRVGSYKANNLALSPFPYSIVCFHGDPKPHTFTEGWVNDCWRV